MTVRHLFLSCLFAVSLTTASAAVNPRPFTIPALHEWKGSEGTLQLSAQSRILFADARLRPAAEALARDMKTLAGLQLTVVEGKKAAATDVLFIYKPQKKLGAEGYTIDIARSIRVEATERGALHAVQTLLQLAQSGALPCGRIADRPDYTIRGIMMDCGRKYIPLSYLRRLVRTMAYYKMNTLNVHLNDNGMRQFFHDNWDDTYAAFRLESERFPGLTAQDGSYSKAEFRQFILDPALLPRMAATARQISASSSSMLQRKEWR